LAAIIRLNDGVSLGVVTLVADDCENDGKNGDGDCDRFSKGHLLRES
jgi:hypothetical protein